MSEPVLRITGLSKTFPGTLALDNVSLTIERGEVHALVGQNGSGKSTLIKVLAGYHQPDPGVSAQLAGAPLNLGHDAPDALRFVHQDLGLILELNAMDNLALHGGFTRGFAGRVRWRDQARYTRRVLERFGARLDLYRPLSEATPVERTVVAIAAAVQGWDEGTGGVLVLDEPTAQLPHEEVDRLFAMVAEVRRNGTSVLYVSHRLDEIFRIADRVTVLRGGRAVSTQPVSELNERSLARLMVGQDVDPSFRAAVPDPAPRPVALELRDVTGRWLRGVDLTIREGEIVGIAGLAGSGMEELPYAIAGFSRHAATGQIRTPGREWLAIERAAELDIPIVPADRGGEAVIGEFTVGENMSLSVLDRFSKHTWLQKQRERVMVDDWAQRLGVVTTGLDAPIVSLSGGNQQKVMVARCLLRSSPLLVLAEPTAGVDIQTRVAIYETVARLAREGLTVIVSSSDAGDLRAMCTRIVVLRNGRVGCELDPEHMTEHELTRSMERES